MPSPDTIATILLAFGALLAALAICHTEPGAGERYVQARRYHRAGLARHTRTSVSDAVTTPMPALETVPDVAASPFAARTA